MIHHHHQLPRIAATALACAILAWIPATAPGAAPPDRNLIFDRGVASYENGEFETARALFGSIIEAGGFSPDVFYNLGNAQYRMEEPGRAALNYRRALLLDPRHVEAHQNLEFVRRESGLIDLARPSIASLSALAPVSTWSIILTVAAWALALSITWLATRRRGIPRPLVVSCAIAGFFAAATAATALASHHFLETPLANRAIIINQDVVSHTAPASESESVIDLPAGSEVEVILQRAGWLYVGVADPANTWSPNNIRQIRAWIPDSQIEYLWPFNPNLVH